jgi:hypothetical protein
VRTSLKKTKGKTGKTKGILMGKKKKKVEARHTATHMGEKDRSITLLLLLMTTSKLLCGSPTDSLLTGISLSSLTCYVRKELIALSLRVTIANRFARRLWS